jgi:hypothetical protein
MHAAAKTALPNALDVEETSIGTSRLADVWIVRRDFESDGARERGMHVLTWRVRTTANKGRTFEIGDDGVNAWGAWAPSAAAKGGKRSKMRPRNREASGRAT